MREDGYRYVRQYWNKRGNQNWALYEQQRGRARRVGTARSVDEYRRFLGLQPLTLEQEVAIYGHAT